MGGMRVSAWALLCLLLASAVPMHLVAAANPFPTMTFTPSVTDKADYPPSGFLDIKGLAFGEPGDGTLVFRIELANFADQPPSQPPKTCAPPNPAAGACAGGPGSISVFYTTPGGSYRSSVSADLKTGSTAPFDSATCLNDGNFIYCSMKYDTIKVAVGDAISKVYLISYTNVAQDFAPGDLWADETAQHANTPLPTGTDYTVKGTSSAGGAFVDKLSLTVGEVAGSGFAGGSALYNLTVTNLGPATNVTLGQTGLPADYANSFTPVSGALAVNGTLAVKLKVDIPSDAAVGTTQNFKAKVVGAHGFNTTVALSLVVSAYTAPTPTSSNPSGGNGGGPGDGGSGSSGGSSDSSAKKSPGVEFLANILAVGLVVVAMRRRVAA